MNNEIEERPKAELILYPFFSSKSEIILFRNENGFEMRFSRSIFSKKVNSTIKETLRNYIEIEIDESEGTVVAVFPRIHQFSEPADFYYEMSNKEYYEDFHKKLIDEDLKKVVMLSSKLMESQAIPGMDNGLSKDHEAETKKLGFPEFFQPVFSASGHYESYQYSTKSKDQCEQLPTIIVKGFEKIPEGPDPAAIETALRFLTAKHFEEQSLFYTKVFSDHPIIRFKNIKAYYHNDHSEGITIHQLKRCIQLHAYYCFQGPFRKCWIRFNYDPTKDSENYKYQIFELRSKKVNFQLFERPEIIDEVSKSKDWYVHRSFDSKDGFVSLALKNFIIYVLDGQRVADINEEIEELSSSNMLLFD